MKNGEESAKMQAVTFRTKNVFSKPIMKKIISITVLAFLLWPLVIVPVLPAKAEAEKTKEAYVYYEDGEKKSSYNEEQYCNWGTMSTLFIWISVMQLKEKGLIDLEAPVTDYLSDTVKEEITFAYPVTMKDLMNHSAGFQSQDRGRFLLVDETFKPLYDTLKDTVPEQINEPGKAVAFSDWGCLLAAYLVGKVSGMNYEEYVHEHILEPLNMDHTSVYYDYSDSDNVKDLPDNPAILSLFYPVYSAKGTMSDMEILFSDLTSPEGKLLKKETRDEWLSGSMNYYGLSDKRLSYGLAYYYEFAEPVIGIRGFSFMGSQECYITPDCRKFYIRSDNSVVTGLEVNSEAKQAPAEFLGRADVKSGPFRAKLSDMDGIYVRTDYAKKGIGRFISFLDTAKYVPKGDDALAVGSSGRPAAFTQISETCFVNRYGETGYFYRSGKTCIFEFPMVDYVEYPESSYVLQSVMLVLYYTGNIYSFLALVIALIVFVIQKITHKDIPESRFKKYHLIQCACFGFHSVFFHMMVISDLSGINNSVSKSSELMYYFSIVISFVYLLFYGKTGFKEKSDLKNRVLFAATAFFAVVLMVFNFAFGLILHS